ncbi:NAD(P)-dependent oxidoreductase [Cyclobacterium marinum]|uniref:NAD(P)-dependent oxidoreductase n=1 Tax=Cyclobacterium marinum TaxID=104 RepID=UPI0018DC5127|nr:NAD(P)-dependent oxidoreductase [Cyclobacterium marinum]MBI0400716.1 NAD(P)-dependent oxidoreductase [Cyclobacterium marinum]
MSIKEMAGYTKDCPVIACCQGHNMNLKGLFGKPKRLVADAIQLLCRSIQKDFYLRPVKLGLMNTAGNRNRDLKKSVSIPEKLVIGFTRALLPPHSDNEVAADYLRVKIGQKNPLIEWVVLRPDALTEALALSPYSSPPTRSAILNPGKTSRINVANAMMRLITEHESWLKWK